MPGTTTRLDLPKILGGDAAASIDDTQGDAMELLDDIAAIFAQGTAAARPTSSGGSPGTVGRLYYATDTGVLSYDYGTGWVDLSAASGAQVFQPGDVKASLASSAPSGWLMADGSTVSRTTYAGLFGVLGTTYNTGGEAGTDFRLPDLRGRALVGKGTHGDVNALGDSDGVAVANRTPKHQHTVVAAGTHSHGGATAGVGDHTHQFLYTNNPHVGVVGGGLNATNSSDQWGATGAAGAHAHGIGADGSHTHQVGPVSTPTDDPAYFVVNVMVKT